MDKIAVVAMEGVFPQAASASAFIHNIISQKNCITQVPDDRWIYPPEQFVNAVPAPDKAISKMAGFIDPPDIDPAGFALNEDIISCLDPVHHLVLHAARNAYIKCSHTKEQKKRTGVILASIALPTPASSLFSSQVIFQRDLTSLTALDVTRTGMVSYPASILARAMGFEAGCYTLDAACASSLFSIKLACEQLSLKKADIMVAGGVSKPSSLYTQIGFTQLQALSGSGTCSPFDARADGLVVGEGTGIVVLKRLKDAVSQGDTIHAVITACGVSNDIEGNLVGPASEGQVRAMARAYDIASWTPNDIQYMECHGSGTPVGDQIELTSIKQLLDTFECPQKSLPIGSVKSMIGHLLTAAGCAGFIKTVLSMNQSVLPPSLNYSSPSEKSPINFSNIHVQTQAQEWTPVASGQTRKAAVSAFGFGGINAHLLVEEFSADKKIYPAGLTTGEDKFESVPCAIVGMALHTKTCDSLIDLENVLLEKQELTYNFPDNRWKAALGKAFTTAPGLYLEEIDIGMGQFHIPPNQISDILPQHLALLKAAYNALIDADIAPRSKDPKEFRKQMGCAIGIDFDYGATDFHLRWQNNDLDDEMKNEISSPLTFNRTLGALGGIVASRVAREFQLGGPCFTLSASENSGIQAIEVAIASLSSFETDTFICGAVDLSGDLRQYVRNCLLSSEDENALFSEGSAAVVLKRYDQAVKDEDRIYAVVSGSASGSGNPVPGEKPTVDNTIVDRYRSSVLSACVGSQVSLDQIGLFETGQKPGAHLSGFQQHAMEQLLSDYTTPADMRFTSTSTLFGNTGVVSALFSVIKTGLCLYRKYRPAEHYSLCHERWDQAQQSQDRIACVSSMSTDGAFGHLIMSEHVQISSTSAKKKNALIPEKFNKRIILSTNPYPVSEKTVHAVSNARFKNSTPSALDPGCIQNESKKNAALPEKNFIRSDEYQIDPALISRGHQITSNAHTRFLDLTTQNMKLYEDQFSLLTQMAQDVVCSMPNETQMEKETAPVVFLDRSQCLEYAVGKAGNVLGKAFDIIDTYPVRVRLPAEPLMLVDRIIDIQGEMLSLGPGKIITQHDVLQDAWYLDGPKTPVSISIEAGQADLFLCAWLGIDHAVKGRRRYRLLDAKVTFHRTLPEAGETIEYHIEIDRFLKQGDVYLFFFHYEGFINNERFISMRDGCAGFFTEAEVENSGGIVLTAQDEQSHAAVEKLQPFVDVNCQGLNDQQVQSLRSGQLESAFGASFKGLTLGKNLCLPGGKMHLIDRVLQLNPVGGRFALGSIVAQSDIHPDDWFLTCHFIDDMVMPGTLMYECCAHALRIFTQRIGWISERDDVFYDVMLDNESDLKCRGPVTRQTRHARYEIEIKQIGYNPEPYVIADAHMFSDDLRIVLYKNMGLKLVGLTEQDLKNFWKNR